MNDNGKSMIRIVKTDSNGASIIDLSKIDLIRQTVNGVVVEYNDGFSLFIDVDFVNFILQLSENDNMLFSEKHKILYDKGFVYKNGLYKYPLDEKSYIAISFDKCNQYIFGLFSTNTLVKIVDIMIDEENFNDTTVENIIELFRRVNKKGTIESRLVQTDMFPVVDCASPITWSRKCPSKYRVEVKQFVDDGTFLYVNGERQVKLLTSHETKKALTTFLFSLEPLICKLTEMNFVKEPVPVGCRLTHLSYSLVKNCKSFFVNIYPCLDRATFETHEMVLEMSVSDMFKIICDMFSEMKGE